MVININKVHLEIFSLYRCDYHSQFHIRQMARLIGKSHAGLLPYLKEFEKNNLLISREVGKSRVYSINLNNPLGKDLLSIVEKKEAFDLIGKEILIKKIRSEFNILQLNELLILFGSYASKTNTAQSDIDLLYIGKIGENERKKIKNLGKIYNRDIHLVVMTSEEFREQLSKQGALIKEVFNNHIILNNSDVFVNEVWKFQ